MMHKLCDFFRAGFGRKIFFGLVLISGVFASCEEKLIKTTVYQIDFGLNEYTRNIYISEPEVQKAFDDILSVLATWPQELEKPYWTVEIVNDRFDAEDKNAETRYNDFLTKLKVAEAECREIIGALGTRYESSFSLKPVLSLTRWVPADELSTLMREYRFELNYN